MTSHLVLHCVDTDAATSTNLIYTDAHLAHIPESWTLLVEQVNLLFFFSFSFFVQASTYHALLNLVAKYQTWRAR